MLDIFRKRGLSSIVFGVLIVGMILVFVIGFRPNAGQKVASLKDACVGTVRGYCIDPKSHKASYRLLIPRDQSGNLLTGRAKQMGLSKIALDGLIERELLVIEAERLGLTVSEEEITEEIFNGFVHVSVPSENPALAYSLRIADGRIFAGFKDAKTKQFDMKVYERSIRMMTGRSATEFREWQGRELLASKVRDLVRAPIRVSEGEALERYVDEKSNATVKYIAVRQSYFEKYAVTATQAQIDEWAKDKANASQVKPPMLRHILVRTTADASADEKIAAQKRIDRALERIRRGESFADVAREVSQDPGSARNGGELGDKTEGFVEPFRKAADALKPGQMTETPIETQFGLHIIKKDDPTRAAYMKAKSLEVAKDAASRILADIKAGKSPDDAIRAVIAPLVKPVAPAARAEADAGPSDAAAPPPAPPTADTDKDRPELVTSSAFNRGGDPIPALSSDAASIVSKFAFSAKDGDTLGELVRNDDGFLIVQLKDHKSATKDEFEKDRDTYLQTLLAAKQAEALGLYVKRLRDAAKADIKIDETYLLDAKGDAGVPQHTDEEDEGP